MTDAQEIARLKRKHKDIWDLGAGALERETARKEAQLRMSAFVSEHGLRCFKCGTIFNAWAKTGIGGRGAWAICVQCVRRKP